MYRDPTIYNLDAPIAGTVYSQVIPDGVSKVLIASRELGSVQVSYESDFTTYITIPASSTKYLENLQLKGKTFYFKSSETDDTIEIEVWK